MGFTVQVLAATLAADIGGALGAGIGALSPRRLHLLIWVAAGAMLAITCFDVAPESYRVLGLLPTALAALSGYGLLWLVGRYVFHVCPACALGEMGEDAGGNLAGKSIYLLAGALGVHCMLDGVALAAGESAMGRADFALLAGISLHKLPEGLALTLLLIGAGFTRSRAFTFAVLIEALTLIGGLVAIVAFKGIDPRVMAAIEANVGGGFLYLVYGTVVSARDKVLPAPKLTLYSAGLASFLATSGVLFCLPEMLSK